jgi:hypothetical protein
MLFGNRVTRLKLFECGNLQNGRIGDRLQTVPGCISCLSRAGVATDAIDALRA